MIIPLWNRDATEEYAGLMTQLVYLESSGQDIARPDQKQVEQRNIVRHAFSQP